MTPKQYAQKYKQLEVILDDGPVTVCVQRYRCGIHTSRLIAKATTLIDKDDETLDVIVKTVHGEYDTRHFDRSKRRNLTGILQDPFCGKGSPEEVQVLLQVGVKCGFLKKEELGKFCASGEIGLDCCGFVSNYVWHAVMRRPWDVDTTKNDQAASMYIPSMILAGRPIKTEKQVQENASRCLVFATADENGKVIVNGAKGAHVMITEPNTTMTMTKTNVVATPKGRDSFQHGGQSLQAKVTTDTYTTVEVVESTGGGKGLVNSRYQILSVDEKTGVFHVKRGCSNGTLHVRIATLGV
jgi:hypothetical protein